LEEVDRLVELENLLFDNALNEVRLAGELKLGRCYVIGLPAVAYALVRPDGHLLDLMRLGVLPIYQGEGLGRRLLEHVLGLGKRVVLTVRKDNLRAKRMYLLAGFTCVGVLPLGDALVMSSPCP